MGIVFSKAKSTINEHIKNIYMDGELLHGNKRIAATLFIYFLNFYDILYKKNEQVIDNNTLTALTLLIGESNPKEKM